jgi:hypothetical protein
MLHELKQNINKELNKLTKLDEKEISIINNNETNNKLVKSKLSTINENDDDELFDDYVKNLIDSMQILKFNVRLNYGNESIKTIPVNKQIKKKTTVVEKNITSNRFKFKFIFNDKFKKKVVRFKE